MESNSITLKDLLASIPDELLVNLSHTTQVDYQVKKLYGRSMFYLLLYGLLERERTSLRSLEDVFNSQKFKIVFNLDRDVKTKFNSISDRLNTMQVDYFKCIYEYLYQEFSKQYNHADGLRYNITRVDSTMVCEAANKIQAGMVVGTRKEEGPKQVKYTMSMTNSLPSSVETFFEQKYLSEDISIPEAIKNHIDKSKDNIFVFDRGVASRKTFNELDNGHLLFVTRINPGAKHEVVTPLVFQEGIKEGNLTIERDDRVVLFDMKCKRSNLFRLLRAKDDEGCPFWLLTNMMEEEPANIVKIYKKRWDIEVFFRFIKQELNFKHFISTNINGIKITLYMTMILSILILIYKKFNNLGYKTAKRRLYYEIEELYMAIIIVLSGGNPNLVFR